MTMTKTPSLKRAAIYARFSTEKQDARSIDDQVRRCKAHAEKLGMVIGEVFSDEAMSGSNTDRPGLQRLLTEAGSPRTRSFDIILVDDLSRLSRDVFDMGRIVFQELAGLNVQVIDVMTGMSSDAPVARQLFTSIGSGNDLFLQMVKAETHRGLEGRALAGFWTGGRVYGYAMVEEENPTDPEHPRKTPTVNKTEADVIRRIFDQYISGYGLGYIADELNKDGIAAPYDNKGYGKVGGRGWGQSTIRAILQNERYVGVWVWNKRKWLKVPGKNAKRAVMRPESEWVVKELPELAIIKGRDWEKVQKMFGERKGKNHRNTGDGGKNKTPHLLSGIIKCGVCGSNMTIVGSGSKNGERYYQFGCAANHSKGETICSNGTNVSELKVNEAIVNSLRTILLTPELIERFVSAYRTSLQRAQNPLPPSEIDSGGQQALIQARIRNLTEAISKVGYSQALGDQLKNEEAALQAAKARSVERKPGKAVPKLDRAAVEALLTNLLTLVTSAPLEAREALKHYLGPIKLTPAVHGDERSYVAEGALNLSALIELGPLKVQKLKTPESNRLDPGLIENASCGGPITPKSIKILSSAPGFIGFRPVIALRALRGV